MARRTWPARSPGRSRSQPPGEPLGLLVGELAVEQAKRLRGDGRRVADRAARVGVGRVVGRQDRHQQRPLHVDVDAPPGRFVGGRCLPAVARNRLAGQHLAGNRRADARPARLEIQAAADGQDRVADLLGRQPAHREPPEPAVARVLGQARRRRPRRHAVGAREQDQPVHPLDPPAAVHELGGQPVEQFGMRRRLAELAEVVGRGHDAPAEVVLPEPVDHAPGPSSGCARSVSHSASARRLPGPDVNVCMRARPGSRGRPARPSGRPGWGCRAEDVGLGLALPRARTSRDVPAPVPTSGGPFRPGW